jgi:transposase
MNKQLMQIKLLILHIKSKPDLYRCFNFTYRTQKYKLSDILTDIIYIMKTGISYRNLRSVIKWQTVYKVYRKLVKHKVFELTYAELLRKYLKKGSLNKKLKLVSTDTTFIMNKNGRQKIGLNKYYYKKRGNKLSLIIDSKGTPLVMDVFKGGKNDGKILENHLEKATIINDPYFDCYKKYFMADSMYDSKIIHLKLKEICFKPLIEQNKRGIKNKKLIRRFSKKDYKIYCKRSKVENVICRLKQMRRINTRYDALISTYKSYVYLGMLNIYCK